MGTASDTSQGEKLLSAVERILADTASIMAMADGCRERAKSSGGDEASIRARAARMLVSEYSTRTAVSGGLSALPGIVPGIGTLVAVAGGALADVGFLLKFEVEMALALSHLYEYDIRNETERQRAFLLASVSMYDAKSGENFMMDVARAETVALWTYAPREVSKLLLTVLTRLALRSVTKGVLRAVPFVGIAVSSGMNKVLTTHVGERCVQELDRRVQQSPASGDVVDAHVRA